MFQLRGDSSRYCLVDELRGARFDLIHRPNSTATATRGQVVCGELSMGFAFGHTIAVDPATGRQVWVYRIFDTGASWGTSLAAAHEPPTAMEFAMLGQLAAEAILVQHYLPTEGTWDMDLACVERDGRRGRASDFGYLSGADIHHSAVRRRGPSSGWRRLERH